MRVSGYKMHALLLAAAIVSASFSAQINSLIGADGKLPESVQQEVNAAVDRAARYVAAKQLPDGTWDGLEAADSDLTALSVRVSPIEESALILRRRLKAVSEQLLPQTNTVPAYAARSILLALSQQTNAAWQVFEKMPLSEIKKEPGGNINALLPAAEAFWTFDAIYKQPQRLQPVRKLLAAQLQAEPKNSLHALAESLITPTPSPFVASQTVAAHKRLATPNLKHRDLAALRADVVLCSSHPEYAPSLLRLPDDSLVDWRQHVAESLVARQRIDPSSGYGYWTQRDEESIAVRIRATALALRILAEL